MSAEKKYANGRYYKGDFRGKDLSNADMRGAILIDADFTGADLKYANLNGTKCYGANFTDANIFRTSFQDATLAKSIMKPKSCYGITLTMVCDTVDEMKVNKNLWLSWVYMALMMEPDDPECQEMQRALKTVLGTHYDALKKIFTDRQVI